MLKELVIPTSQGPVVLRPRQVLKIEGVPLFFMIESVNEVPNGKQIRVYQFDEREAVKYYVPLRTVPTAPVPGTVPAYANSPINGASGQQPNLGAGFHPVNGITEQPPVYGIVPNATIPDIRPVGEVPEHLAPMSEGSSEMKKPIQGLSQAEIQDGLAAGKFTQDSEGNIFRNQNFRDPDDPNSSASPNHIINPGAADE